MPEQNVCTVMANTGSEPIAVVLMKAKIRHRSAQPYVASHNCRSRIVATHPELMPMFESPKQKMELKVGKGWWGYRYTIKCIEVKNQISSNQCKLFYFVFKKLIHIKPLLYQMYQTVSVSKP